MEGKVSVDKTSNRRIDVLPVRVWDAVMKSLTLCTFDGTRCLVSTLGSFDGTKCLVLTLGSFISAGCVGHVILCFVRGVGR